MQTIAYTYDTPLYLKAKSFYDQELVCNDHIACNAGVEVMNAFFDWENARPVLILTGQVDELAGFFPDDITHVTFGKEFVRPQVRFRWELSDEDLAKFCKKGLFSGGTYGLPCPNKFKTAQWVLPVTCACSCLPSGRINQYDAEFHELAPLLFVSINDQFAISIPKEKQEYDLESYYPEKSLQDQDMYDDELEFVEVDMDYDAPDIDLEEDEDDFSESVVREEEQEQEEQEPESEADELDPELEEIFADARRNLRAMTPEPNEHREGESEQKTSPDTEDDEDEDFDFDL